MKDAKEICPTTAYKKAFEEGALFVDVRRPAEVETVTFDVPNYVNIPLNELEDRINEIPKDKDVVMVCHSGSRSLRTTLFLTNNGYDNVYNMRDGILKWARKRFPLKGDTLSLTGNDSCDCSQPDCC